MNLKLIPKSIYFLIVVAVISIILYFTGLLDVFSDKDSFYFGFLTSFFGALITAIAFFLLFRPKIIISDKIVTGKTDDGKDYYQFKFINTSLFSASDARVSLFFGQPKEKGHTQVDVTYDQLEMSRVQAFYVPRWKPVFEGTRLAPHCVKIKFLKEELKKIEKFGENPDLETMLSSFGAKLELRIALRHGLSNLARTITKEFNRKECILDEEFEFGNCLKTKKC